jgi:predicted RNA binding protein YcfA (HicA-like mRNA interferase family)
MAKLPVVSGKQLVKVLERHGYVHDRTKGDHAIMVGSGTVSVPLHRELKTGTLKGILRDAGLSKDNLINALR